MNAAQITHIFWKEYRTQRSIWLGFIATCWICQLMVWLLLPDHPIEPMLTLLSIAETLSVFYVLASAGVSFAGEREEGTHEWLKNLPLSLSSLFAGKLLWLAISALLVAAVTSFTAYLPFWGDSVNTERIRSGLIGYLKFGGALSLWAVFFSLFCDRIYTAIAMAPISLLLSAGLISFVPGLEYLIYPILLVAIAVQGRRWMREERLLGWAGARAGTRGFTLNDALATSMEVSPAWRFFRRELWLEWRNARWVAFGSVLILTAVILFLAASGLPGDTTIIWFLLIAVLPLLYGVNTVRGEQYQSRYRFQSNVGASPAAVWTAKHLVWGGLLFLTMVVSSLPVWVAWLVQAQSYSRFQMADWLYQQLPVPQSAWPDFLYVRFSESWWPAVWLSMSMAVWMYAVGHVCSLLIKRSVSAALVAVALGALICVPVAATLMLDVPRVIGILLPAGFLLLFGLWRTRGWLSERNETRDWLTVFGVLTVLALVCMTSWMVWRISELTMLPSLAAAVSLFPIAGLKLVGGLLLVLLLPALVVWRRKLTFKRVFLGWCTIHVLSGIACVAAVDADAKLRGAPDREAPVPSQAALQTGDFYREMELLIPQMPLSIPETESSYFVREELFAGEREISDEQLAWLNDNEANVNRLLEITQRPDCALRESLSEWSSDNRRQLQLGQQTVVDLLRLSALRAERAGELSPAWEYHLATLRLQRHYLSFQAPTAREWNVAVINDYYRADLNRWINHPSQTPQLLEQAAKDFSGILAKTARMTEAIELKSSRQISALRQNQLGAWVTWDRSNVMVWPRLLDQALHASPWERQRALYMLERIGYHQRLVARGIEQGEADLYGSEIASANLSDYGREWTIWNWYEGSIAAQEDAALWRLAETTPLFQADQIEGFGTAPRQDAWMWIREVRWVRNRRLVTLAMAFRAAELEQEEPVNSLEQLLELKKYPAVRSILNSGEQTEAEKDWRDRSLRDDYPVEFQKYWFYVDPVRNRRFDMKTIDKFRNPPVN